MREINWLRTTIAITLLIALPIVASGCVIGVRAGGVAMTVGSVANGHIVAPGARVRYPLTVPYPANVRIFVDGHGLDPTVSLYNAAGGRLAYNDDAVGLDSQIMMPLAPGSYIIEVAGYGSSVGPFTISVN